MITPASLALYRFGFHGGGFAFLIILAAGIAVFVWALTRSSARSGRNSA